MAYKTLNEELCISKEVSDVSKCLVDEIYHYAETGVKYKQGSIILTDFAFQYSIFGFIYHIYGSMVYDDYDRRYFAKTSLTAQTMQLNLLITHEEPSNTDFYDIVYHEVLHIYQYTRAKANVLSIPKINTVYSTVIRTLSDSHNAEETMIFANAVYASFDFEQDAMLHGLYGQLISLDYPVTVYDYYSKQIYDNSEVKLFINDIIYTMNHIEHVPQTFLEDICMTRNRLFKTLDNAKKRIETKACKVLQKARNDFKMLNEHAFVYIRHRRR